MPSQRLASPTVLLSVAIFAAMLGLGMMVPALPVLTAGGTAAAAGMIVSTFGIARLVVSFPSGIAADRFGLRSTAVVGLLLLAGGSIVGAVPLGYSGLVVAVALQGVGSSIFSTAVMTALVLLAGPERRAAAMSWFQGALLLALSLGPVVGGWLIGVVGPRGPFEAQAVLSLLALAVVPVLPASVPKRPGARSVGAPVPIAATALIGGASMGFSAFAARVGTAWATVPAVAATVYAMPPERLGWLIGLATLVNFAVLPTVSRSIDRHGAARVLALTTAATLFGLALLAGVRGEAALWIGTIVVMAATGATLPAAGVVALEGVTPAATGRAMGAFRMAGDVGMALGPLIATGSAAALGMPAEAGFTVIAAVVLAAGLVFAASRMLRAPAAAG